MNTKCDSCSTGCTGRLNDQSRLEEINAAPYLVWAAVMVVIASLAVKWFMS